MKSNQPQSHAVAGFTLLELLVVIAIIAILAALTLGGTRFAQTAAAKNRTVAAHGLIKSALEIYKEKFGEYPAPSNPTGSTEAGGKEIRAGGARMLYQAITGDGYDQIQLNVPPPGVSPQSDGRVDEGEVSMLSEPLPKGMYTSVPGRSDYYVVDGWGRPFQYTKGGNDTLTPDYDLWSFGNIDSRAGYVYDAESRRNQSNTATWVKNW